MRWILALRRILSLRRILVRGILSLWRIRRLRVLESSLAGLLVDIEPSAVLLIPAGDPRRRHGGRTRLLSLALGLALVLVRQATGEVLEHVHVDCLLSAQRR